MQKKTISTSEHYNWGDNCEGWHFLKRNDLSIIKETMPPGTSEQMDFHKKSRQFFYVLSGVATFNFEKQIININPAESIEIEPEEYHQIRNQGASTLEFILISSPGNRDDRVNL